MQFTRSASTGARRMSPSPDWLEDMLRLARTKPVMLAPAAQERHGPVRVTVPANKLYSDRIQTLPVSPL
jgi:hypothetical protein